MGRRRKRSKTIRRTRGNNVSINLVLFIVAISLFVLLRLTSIIAIVSDSVCDQHPSFFRSDWNIQPTTIETFALAGVLVLIAQVIWAVQFLRNWSWPHAILGTINIMAAGGVIVYCLVCWSFFYPAHPVAKYVNSWGPTHQFMTTVDRVSPPDWQKEYFDTSSHWEQVNAHEFTNSKIGVTARYEVIRECFAEEFDRLNFEARFPNNEFVPDRFTELGWVYFDPDNRLIAPDSGRFNRNHIAVIKRLPSPDWQAPASEYWDLMDYIVKDEAEIQHAEIESRPSLTETYNEIIRILDEE